MNRIIALVVVKAALGRWPGARLRSRTARDS
jgi:hypothetical protein